MHGPPQQSVDDTTRAPLFPTEVVVADDVFTVEPDYALAILLCDGADSTSSTESAAWRLARAQAALRADFDTTNALDEDPEVTAWHAAYRRLGVSPRRFPFAADSLTRRVLKGGVLPTLGAIVDTCNAVSISSRMPIAACDAAGIAPGPLHVRRANGDEVFLPLGSPEAPEHPAAGEIVYADSAGNAHSRRWNWRQSHLVRTTSRTRTVIVTVESVRPDGAQDVAAIAAELADLLETSCSRVRRAGIITRERPRIGISL